MNRELGNHPLRNQVLNEFQIENDLLGITATFQAGLLRKVDEKLTELESPELESERTRLQHELDQTRSAIDHEAPVTPVMYQYGSSLILCLRREYEELGLAIPGSTVTIASSEVDSGEYVPEQGFTSEQVDAVLGQLARYMSFSELH